MFFYWLLVNGFFNHGSDISAFFSLFLQQSITLLISTLFFYHFKTNWNLLTYLIYGTLTRGILLLLHFKNSFRNVFPRLKNIFFTVLTEAQNFSTNAWRRISNTVVIFKTLINYLYLIIHPTFLHPKSFLNWALIRYLLNLITLKSLNLILVLIVTVAIAMILPNVISTDLF